MRVKGSYPRLKAPKRNNTGSGLRFKFAQFSVNFAYLPSQPCCYHTVCEDTQRTGNVQSLLAYSSVAPSLKSVATYLLTVVSVFVDMIG